MLIGSSVELHVGLHSCLCFLYLKKLVLKAYSTPPRYLAVCWAFSAFSYRNPDNSSTLGGSIENAFASSIASRHLLNRSRFWSGIWWFVPRYLLDTCICRWPFSRHLPRHLHLSRFIGTLFKLPVRSRTHFPRSLSRYFSISLPKTLSSHSNNCFSRILQAFSSFSLLGKPLILSHSCISCFWNLGFGVFEKNFRFFQHWWAFIEILGWVFT